MITEAPYTFLIEGKLIFNPLKNSDIGLAYSNIPTKINAYTYAGKAIERLRAQLKKLWPGNLQNVINIARGTAIKVDNNAELNERIIVFKNRSFK